MVIVQEYEMCLLDIKLGSYNLVHINLNDDWNFYTCIITGEVV
jgi:hypothetical protein